MIAEANGVSGSTDRWAICGARMAQWADELERGSREP